MSANGGGGPVRNENSFFFKEKKMQNVLKLSMYFGSISFNLNLLIISMNYF